MATPEAGQSLSVLLATKQHLVGFQMPRVLERSLGDNCDLTMHLCPLSALQDYPEQRLQFFALLRAITSACFATLLTMSPAQLKLVIDSIIWAFRHTERNVADTGESLLHLYIPPLVL